MLETHTRKIECTFPFFIVKNNDYSKMQGSLEYILEQLIRTAQRFLAVYSVESYIYLSVFSFIRDISYNNTLLAKIVARIDNTSPNRENSIITRIAMALANPNVKMDICEQGLRSLQNLTCDNCK